MTPAQLRQANVELGLTRRRRELFFWTIRMTLTVIVSIAMTIALVVSLIQGASIDVAQMSLGAGITAVNAASGQILGLLRRLVRLKAPP